jgi:3-deoxy-manno-octulosonate cytidylyltransferase (CMP-KDO synthetase)
MPVTIATIIAVSTEAMILFHSKDDIGALSAPLCGAFTGPRPRRGRSKPDSARRLNSIITLPAIARTGHLVAPRAQPSKTMTRTAPHNPIVMIPSRLASTRLPRKPLADIGGAPMIVHVWRRAVAAGLGPVAVACGDAEIARAIEEAGGRAVMTDPDLPTGSDRIHAAVSALDPGQAHDAVINVQGDMPLIAPEAIRLAYDALADPQTDIATLASIIEDPAQLTQDHVNKVVAGFTDPALPAIALYFSKLPVPWGDGPHYEHIGLYAYRRDALERYVRLPRGVLEIRERLEQLRALEAGMRITVRLVAADRHGGQVDTPGDLERVRALVAKQT